MMPALHLSLSLSLSLHLCHFADSFSLSLSYSVGTKNLRFCLFGDTMNTAARMEQHGKPRHIHASRAVRDAASSEKWIESFTEVKGKGKMQTFYLKVID